MVVWSGSTPARTLAAALALGLWLAAGAAGAGSGFGYDAPEDRPCADPCSAACGGFYSPACQARQPQRPRRDRDHEERGCDDCGPRSGGTDRLPPTRRKPSWAW